MICRRDPDDLSAGRVPLSNDALALTRLRSSADFQLSQFLAFGEAEIADRRTFYAGDDFVFDIRLGRYADSYRARYLELADRAAAARVRLSIVLLDDARLIR